MCTYCTDGIQCVPTVMCGGIQCFIPTQATVLCEHAHTMVTYGSKRGHTMYIHIPKVLCGGICVQIPMVL